jgi:hypothetical protein
MGFRDLKIGYKRRFSLLDRWIVRRLWSHRTKRWRNAGWREYPTKRLRAEFKLVNLVARMASSTVLPKFSEYEDKTKRDQYWLGLQIVGFSLRSGQKIPRERFGVFVAAKALSRRQSMLDSHRAKNVDRATAQSLLG